MRPQDLAQARPPKSYIHGPMATLLLLELSCSELRTLLRAVTLPDNAPSPFPFSALRLPLPRPPVSWQDADRLVGCWPVPEHLVS